MNKNSFTLLITLFFVFLISILTVNILETKSIKNKNIENKYLYIQAKNHINFLKQYIQTLTKDELKNTKHILIKNDLYKIEAFIKNENSIFTIEMFVKSKNTDISLYKQLVLNN